MGHTFRSSRRPFTSRRGWAMWTTWRCCCNTELNRTPLRKTCAQHCTSPPRRDTRMSLSVCWTTAPIRVSSPRYMLHVLYHTDALIGWSRNFRRGRSLLFLSSPFFSLSPLPLFSLSLEIGPHKRARGPGGTPAENKFGALYSCQKATGGNHFEYSEYHVLRAWRDKNGAGVAIIQHRCHISGIPWVTASLRRRKKGGGAEPARPPSKWPLADDTVGRSRL